jgi:RHS repeat-associated protein
MTGNVAARALTTLRALLAHLRGPLGPEDAVRAGGGKRRRFSHAFALMAVVAVGMGVAVGTVGAAGGPGTVTTTRSPGTPPGRVLPNDPTVTTSMPVCGDQDGSETPLVFNCSQYTQVVDQRFYQVGGTGSVSVHFDYVFKEAICDNQVSVFKVDNANGSIGGVLPGDPAWPAQVSSRNPQVVYGPGSNPSSPDVNLPFQAGDLLGFRAVLCGTTYYSYEQANPDAFDHLLVFQNAAGQPWQFAWEDSSGGGDQDFNDMVFNVSGPPPTAASFPPAQSFGTSDGSGINALAPTGSFADAVNTLTGAFTISETDLTTPGLGIPFAMVRSYTSADSTVGRLGPGWTDGFSASLAVQSNGDVLLHGEDGQEVYYTHQADGSFLGAAGALSTLSAITGGYKLVRHDQVTYTFNSSGVLQSELDRNGQGLTFAYDTSGRLVTVTDAAGRAATLAYNAGNLLSSITTSDGRTVSYDYTGGALSSVTLPDPDGAGPLSSPVWSYSYDPSGRLASEVDPNQHPAVSNVYDPASGRVSQQTDANGNITKFAWDAATTTATVTDPNLNIWKDVYANNILAQRIDPGGDTTQLGHDANLDTNAVTAPDGTSKTTLMYDNHNLTTATAPASLGSVQKTLIYDAQNNVKTVTDARGKVTAFGYDTAGNNNSITLGGQPIASAVYNAQGEMLSSTDGNNKTTNYTYDSNGNLASVTDPLGNKTTYTYDGAGRVLTVVDPLGNCTGCIPANFTTSYSYDADGHLLSVSDELNHATRYVYDAAGNKTSETDANDHTTNYQYDNANHLTKVTGADPDGTGPLEAPITTYAYDTAGNRVAMVDPLGNCTGCNAAAHTTGYGYNANNQIASVTDPLGNKTTYSYDANGNLASTVDPRGNCTGCNPANFTTSYSYDAAGRLLTTTDPLGHVITNHYDPTGNLDWTKDANQHQTSFTYDAAGRTLTVTAPDGGLTTYTYDPNGNLLSRKDDNLHLTIYSYDPNGHLLTTTDPLNHTTTNHYDANGNLDKTTKPSGGTISSSYDHANRLTGISYSDTTPAVTYGYDPVGNRTSMSDAAGSHSYTYDALNRLLTATRGSDGFSYSYDLNNNITQRAYPGGTAINYTYDADNELATAAAGNQTNTLSYDPAGHLVAIDHGPSNPNDYIENFSYDAAGRLTGEVSGVAGEFFCSPNPPQCGEVGGVTRTGFAATLDPVGNPTQIVRSGDLTGTTTYSYDANNRITAVCYQATCPNGTDPFIRWTYDKVGNRLTQATPTATTAYSYNADDQLTQAGSTIYTYDANGNEKTAGSTTLSYDLANRLKTLISGNTTTNYSYDGDGNRLQASTGTAAAKITNYLWDTNAGLPQLALERDGNNAVLRTYIYGNRLLAMLTGGTTYDYTSDTVGSVAELTDTTGLNPQWAYAYDPYGTTRTTSKLNAHAPTNLYQYTSQYQDPTGLYYLHARQYDPSTGRFLQQDPVDAPITQPYTGAYVYAADQPTVLIDPSGQTFSPADLGPEAAYVASSDFYWFETAGTTLGYACSDRTVPGNLVTRWNGVVRCVLHLLHQVSSVQLVNDVDILIRFESGGNRDICNRTDINAQLGHPSCGLVQVIQPTFDVYRSHQLPDKLTDPAANVYAGLNCGRHGSTGHLIQNINGIWRVNHGLSYQGYGCNGPKVP